MRNYSILTMIISLPTSTEPEKRIPVITTLPDNAMVIGVEVRPAFMPEGLLLHYLVPCDDEGNPIEMDIAMVYETAWNELYKVFGERLEQGNIDLMDSVLKTLMLEMESEAEAKREIEGEG